MQTDISEVAEDRKTSMLRYIKYLHLVTRVFHHLKDYYSAQEGSAPESSEAESMTLYMEKLLESIFALRLKYRFSPEYLVRPTVGLAESGFPQFTQITLLDADRSTRDERLPKLPELEDLKELLLNLLFAGPPKEGESAYDERLRRYKENEIAYLWQIAERAYLERLDLRKQFFAFTPGKLFLAEQAKSSDEDARRTYVFSWGCYDLESNAPCMYFMLFEQEGSETPLDAPQNPEYLKFLELIRSIAGRAPKNLMAVAARLDESLNHLYPKVLKRIRIGPLVAPLLTRSIEDLGDASLAARLMPIFERAHLTERDYALFFSTEYVESEREVLQSGIFASFTGGKPRQIFHVPRGNQDLLERGATAAFRHVLTSHQLMQHVTEVDYENVPELKGVNVLVYPEHNEGGIFDVG